ELPMSEPFSGFRRGAPFGRDNSPKTTRLASTAHIVNFNPRDSPAGAPSPSSACKLSGAVYGPRRGSTILSVTRPHTIVRSITDADENQKLAVSETDMLGFSK